MLTGGIAANGKPNFLVFNGKGEKIYESGNDNKEVGDTYVFILGDGGPTAWNAGRATFLSLTGPIPVLPDFAYGTWFTWWHPYTEAEAKGDLARWKSDGIPIDVWGIDVNWRIIKPPSMEYAYNHPNPAFNMDEWFGFLHKEGLHTYFNDHPYPMGLQTSPKEVGYRWNGLTSWMGRGLTFWWADKNWMFSIPPPNTNRVPSHPGFCSWEGLTNVAWISHVYYEITKHYDNTMRDKKDLSWGGRPIALTKFAEIDMRVGMDPHSWAENPSQHRYPVWWTGDNVSMEAAIISMVDSGVYGVKPYVHSDCGGDTFPSPGRYLRWIAFCTFGTIMRLHGGDHRPWIYNDKYTVPWVEPAALPYFRLRYKMAPSLIAYGQQLQYTGFPYVARADLYWPEHGAQSSNNHQYIFIDDILVAPVWESKQNVTGRSVWIPPGDWQDVWDGSIVTGPKKIMAYQPFHRQPMWFRRNNGLIVICDNYAHRIEWQDWKELTLEAFPSKWKTSTQRKVYERRSDAHTDITLSTDGGDQIELDIGSGGGGVSRAWVVRFNLLGWQRVVSATVNGKEHDFVHIRSSEGPPQWSFFPLAGRGTAPARWAGPVAEIRLKSSSGARKIKLTIANIEVNLVKDSQVENLQMKVAASIPKDAAVSGSGPNTTIVAACASAMAAVIGAAAVGAFILRSRRRSADQTRALILES